MKKWIQTFIYCLLAACCFSSCIMDIDKELPDCLPDEVTDPIAVTADLYCNGNKIAWATTSHIGVIMLQDKTNKFVYNTPVKNYFLPDTSTYLFQPQSELQQIGRPEAGTTQNATGIYPHNLIVNEMLEVPFSVTDQSDQQALDLILAKRATGVTHETDTVHLDFYRQLSQLQFNLSLTEIAVDGTSKNADNKLAGAQIAIGGMDASALFSLSDLSFTTSSSASIQAWVTANGKNGQAIVFPRKASDEVTFTVTLPAYPDTVYTFAMDPSLELFSCQTYSFDMDLTYRYSKDEPGPGPGMKYHIDYIFEGEANSNNVDVFKNDISTIWPLGEIITVNDGESFTFSYDSELDVSIRTKDGKVISLNPNTSYNFTHITNDITIIISAQKEEKVHKIRYLYEGDANASNTDVFKNNMTTAWQTGKYITVSDGDDFSFGYSSELEIIVRTAEGKILSVTPDQLYTITNITSSITLIISAKQKENPDPGPGPGPDPVYHKITYEYNGEANTTVVPVTGTIGNTLQPDWGPNEVIFVKDGGSFTFRFDKNNGFTNDVTVTLNGQVVESIKDGEDHVLNHITEDKHFILYDKKHYTVTVIINLKEQATTETNTLVISGDRFELTAPNESKLVVTANGKKVDLTDGKYIIDSVTENTVIIITNDKEDKKPDTIIKADVHDWVELPTIDGGVITPDNK